MVGQLLKLSLLNYVQNQIVLFLYFLDVQGLLLAFHVFFVPASHFFLLRVHDLVKP
jgi:hypothetical protein